MVASVTTIGNLSLQILGQPPIGNFDEEGNKVARELKLAWPSIRDEVQSVWDWNFTRERESLVKDAKQPDFGWKYQYKLPSGFLRAWSIDPNFIRLGINAQVGADTGGRLPYDSGPDFSIESGVLRTNEDINKSLNKPGLPLTFSKLVTDPTKWPSLIVPVKAARLASQVAFAITGSKTDASDALNLYTAWLARAKAENAKEGKYSRPDTNAIRS